MNSQHPNRNCQICDTSYYACNKCDTYASWKSVVDTPNCYAIYCVITSLNKGVITEIEASDQLRDLGINLQSLKKNKEKYKPTIYAKLEEILRMKKSKNKETSKE